MTNETLEKWYQQIPGNCFFEIEKDLLARSVAGSMGSCFLHWSNEDRYELASKVHFEQHIFLSSQNDFPLFTRGLQVDMGSLPFLRESIDIILLPHVLEFIQDPHLLIRESYRILKPGGCLLVLNFNPVSFWGLGKLFFKKKRFPWNGKSISALSLRYLFGRIGFKVIEYKTDFFRPFFSSEQKLENWLPLETVGQLCWPFLGAIYMMVLQKQKEEMIPLKTKAYDKALFIQNRHPEPTTQAHSSRKAY